MDTLRELSYSLGMVDVPNLFGNGAKQFFVALAPIFDVQEGMQKTQNHSDAREQISSWLNLSKSFFPGCDLGTR
jgi:hypothetical protein